MDLDGEELSHLHNVTFGGLMRLKIPSHVEEKLLKSGYIRRAVGGTLPTEGAYKIFKDGK